MCDANSKRGRNYGTFTKTSGAVSDRRHVPPLAHLSSHEPPQSTSVSSPSWDPFQHVWSSVGTSVGSGDTINVGVSVGTANVLGQHKLKF